METKERMAIDVARRIITQQSPLTLSHQRANAISIMAPAVMNMASGVDFSPADVHLQLVTQQLTAAENIYDMASANPQASGQLVNVASEMIAKLVETSPEFVREAVEKHMFGASVMSAVETELRNLPALHESQRQH